MTERIVSLLGLRRKPDEMSEAQRRIYEGAVRQLRARRLIWGEHPEATAPYDRPENASRRVSIPRRVA
jgi:hypothetical protein